MRRQEEATQLERVAAEWEQKYLEAQEQVVELKESIEKALQQVNEGSPRLAVMPVSMYVLL